VRRVYLIAACVAVAAACGTTAVLFALQPRDADTAQAGVIFIVLNAGAAIALWRWSNEERKKRDAAIIAFCDALQSQPFEDAVKRVNLDAFPIPRPVGALRGIAETCDWKAFEYRSIQFAIYRTENDGTKVALIGREPRMKN
jgi:hypothetical protein